MAVERELEVGDQIGDYVLTRYIDEGGEAYVWEATKDGQSYALKVFKENMKIPNLPSNEPYAVMVRAELISEAQQDHQGKLYMPRYHNWFSFGNHAVVVMDLVEGDQLDSLSTGRQQWMKIAKAYADYFQALDVLHSHGLMHCDVRNRSNLLLTANGGCLIDIIGVPAVHHNRQQEASLLARSAIGDLVPVNMTPDEFERFIVEKPTDKEFARFRTWVSDKTKRCLPPNHLLPNQISYPVDIKKAPKAALDLAWRLSQYGTKHGPASPMEASLYIRQAIDLAKQAEALTEGLPSGAVVGRASETRISRGIVR